MLRNLLILNNKSVDICYTVNNTVDGWVIFTLSISFVAHTCINKTKKWRNGRNLTPTTATFYIPNWAGEVTTHCFKTDEVVDVVSIFLRILESVEVVEFLRGKCFFMSWRLLRLNQGERQSMPILVSSRKSIQLQNPITKKFLVRFLNNIFDPRLRI